MPGYFTKIQVADPHRFAQSVWENFPPGDGAMLTEREFSAQDWVPLDRRRFRIELESYRSELSIANIGALRVSRTANNQATRRRYGRLG